MMWPTITTTNPMNTQSWTNVAPVRIRSGNGPNQRMIEPVANMSTIDAPTKTAFSFWPGLNFPSCADARVRLDHQRRSSAVQRLIREMSRRS